MIACARGKARDRAATMIRFALLLLLLAVSGCTGSSARPGAAPAALAGWKTAATFDDLNRLRRWRDAFTQGLAQARAAGHAREIAGEGALLVPDAAIEPVALAAGRYRCRVIKLGSRNDAAGLSYVAYPAFDCRIDDDRGRLRFTKLSGSQRPVGLVYDDGTSRGIFLGTMMLSDEVRAFDYGADAGRDIAGAVQRIGAERWRLIFPYPRFESVIDVMELVPLR